MAGNRDYYQILQISPKADPAIVKAAYYAHLKTLKKHPDLGGDHEEASLINEAYEILGDSERRRQYDQQFLKGFASEASAPEPNPFSPQEELRKHRRFIFQNSFSYRSRAWRNGKWVAAHFRDISLSGACFRSREVFKKGETLELDVSDHPNIKIPAEVRWVRPIPHRFGPPVYEGGVEFKQADEKAFRRWLKDEGLFEVA
ncbi:MAG: PilZ domain-containing protein [Deltaproteobacteria bacterium]|nr:PilZ domain-containing protein [Deltaproteobacteria bacterium]